MSFSTDVFVVVAGRILAAETTSDLWLTGEEMVSSARGSCTQWLQLLCSGRQQPVHAHDVVTVCACFLNLVNSTAVWFNGIKESYRLAWNILSQFKLLWLRFFGSDSD